MTSFVADAGVLDTLAGYVATAKEDPEVELETRLGTWKQNRFCAGVDRAAMDRLVRSMDMHSKEVNTTVVMLDDDWQETEDYFYTCGGRPMRTRVQFCHETMRTTVTTVEKQSVGSMVLKTHVCDVRVALAREVKVEEPPPMVQPTFVRIKQIRRYQAVSSPFVITCSMIWSGATRAQAERQQATTEPVFEIECELELARAPEYAARNDHHIGKSLLSKNVCLMFGDNVTYQCIAGDPAAVAPVPQ